MRILFCLAALLCALGAHASALDLWAAPPKVPPGRAGPSPAAAASASDRKTPGFSGEWLYYGNRDATVRIDDAAGILEDGTTSYILLEEQGPDWRRAVKRGDAHPAGVRGLFRVHENVLLFAGVKNPILVRKGTRFPAPREKIRGRWHHARQMTEAFYYDAEFDLDAGKMVEVSRSESGDLIRSEARPLETLLDAQAELAVRSGETVYHLARLGADFLVLAPSYASSAQNGYKILMERVPHTVKKRAKTGKARR